MAETERNHVTTLTRRRTNRDDEPKEAADERPTRRRNTSSDEEPEREARPRRGRSSGDDDKDDKPTRRTRGSGSSDDSGSEDRPRRGRRSGGDDEGTTRRRSGTGGFASYSQKKTSNSQFAEEFKPGDNNPTLIKFIDAEPFDVYNQHWVDEGAAAGKTRHSFVCRDDEYFADDDDFDKGCPLCDLGEPKSTYSLFNILDLTNPRKPENKVWRTSPAVTDILLRASKDKKTSPLDREDVYFEVEMVKKSKKTNWIVQPVKARDLLEDFDLDPLEGSELEEFEKGKFDSRRSVTKVDTWDELDELAASLED